MRKKSLKYIDLINHLFKNCIAGSAKRPKAEVSEYNAVLSHYLHNPGHGPVFGGAAFKVACEDGINEYLAANRKKPIEDISQLSLNFSEIPFPPPKEPKFTFIDLFAGIGGIRIAFQNAGGRCIFSSEWDKYAQRTYFENFGEYPFGDIKQFTDIELVSDNKLCEMIPDHDILCAGFPCQPFSLAGVSKKNSLGRDHGFKDPTQGTLFFDLKRILKVKRPKAFFLENVKHLLRHDQGKTFEVISKTLDELGYVWNYGIVDASNWVPQNRKRIFIVGFNPDYIEIDKKSINIPLKPENSYKRPTLKTIIQKEVDEKHTLGPGTWATLVRHKEHHAKSGNGFGYGLIPANIPEDFITRTISARYHKDGAEILIEQKGKRPRRLTVDEAKQLQGFDKIRYVFPVSDTQAYRQIGNSVVIPAVETTARFIADIFTKNCR